VKSLCVYCGSSNLVPPSYFAAADTFGRCMARRGIALVYGGGNVGMMGAVADAVLAEGGKVTGVIPRFMVEKELAHTGATEMLLVDSMHERKTLMAGRADAFVALPGGIGTLEELFEVFTWLQLGLHSKPVGILNTDGYYDPMLAFLERMAHDQFIRADFLETLRVQTGPEKLLDELHARSPRHTGLNASKT
jgi:uncharacterized protein (TIGR00730 family)